MRRWALPSEDGNIGASKYDDDGHGIICIEPSSPQIEVVG